jgi:hypothetical protein
MSLWMKRIARLAAACLAATFLSIPVSAEISARFSFGPAFASMRDLADGIRGYDDYSRGIYGSDLSGGFKAPRLGFDLSGELVYSVDGHWGAGLGFGWMSFSRQSGISYVISGASADEDLTARVAAIPIFFNLHYELPMSERASVDAWIGPALYLTKLTWEYDLTASVEGQSGADRSEFKASRLGFGAQAGIVLVYKLSGAVDLTAEIEGRIGSAGGFSGDSTETAAGDFWSFEDSVRAKVWAYDWTYDNGSYRMLSFQENAPSGTGIRDAREAKIGLSGLGVRVGVRVRLPFGAAGGGR